MRAPKMLTLYFVFVHTDPQNWTNLSWLILVFCFPVDIAVNKEPPKSYSKVVGTVSCFPIADTFG